MGHVYSPKGTSGSPTTTSETPYGRGDGLPPDALCRCELSLYDDFLEQALASGKLAGGGGKSGGGEGGGVVPPPYDRATATLTMPGGMPPASASGRKVTTKEGGLIIE